MLYTFVYLEWYHNYTNTTVTPLWHWYVRVESYGRYVDRGYSGSIGGVIPPPVVANPYKFFIIVCTYICCIHVN